MPTYAYRCPAGHEFERFQKMTDPPDADCPTCGQPGERLISGGAGLVFRGSGFYITDYKRAGEPKAREEGAGKSPATGEQASPKPDGAAGAKQDQGTKDEGTKEKKAKPAKDEKA